MPDRVSLLSSFSCPVLVLYIVPVSIDGVYVYEREMINQIRGSKRKQRRKRKSIQRCKREKEANEDHSQLEGRLWRGGKKRKDRKGRRRKKKKRRKSKEKEREREQVEFQEGRRRNKTNEGRGKKGREAVFSFSFVFSFL